MSFRLLFGVAVLPLSADRLAVPAVRGTLFAVDRGKLHLVAAIAYGQDPQALWFLPDEISIAIVVRPSYPNFPTEERN